jgi:hypothetical protein
MSISRTQKAEGLSNLTIAILQPEKFPVTAVQPFFGTCQLESPPAISFCAENLQSGNGCSKIFTSYINLIISGSLEIYRPLAALAVQSNLLMLNQLFVIMLLMMTLSLSL